MDKFVDSIKKKYIERKINKQRQWPPIQGDQLVELELVEEDKGQKYLAKDYDNKATVKRAAITYSKIFEGSRGKRPIRKVLLEGEAGIGKTTVCTSISEDWADRKLFQQFQLVLLLPLRHERVSAAKSLSGLLEVLYRDKEVCDSVVKYLEKEEGEHVLIVADGWDELNEDQRREGSFMYRLLFDDLLPFVSVILTSRPSASGVLRELQCIDRYVEVCGFSKKGIQDYIQAEFTGNKAKASRLMEQLENNPLVESICSVPLNCAIICHLWRTLEGTLPTTMTELYSKIILNLVYRNVLKTNPAESQGVRSLFDLEALPASLRDPWNFLCTLAYQAISKNQIMFSEKELTDFPQPDSTLIQKILCFGLLQAAESILVVGRGIVYHFLHQTFQEYLAAVYLVKLSPDKQLDFCRAHAKSDHVSMLWRFYFGISFQGVQAISTKVQKALFHGLVYSQKLTICHCALESKDEGVTNFVSELLNAGELRLINPRNVSDCSAVINVIINTKMSNRIVISLNGCNLSDTQMLILSDALVRKREEIQVEELNLSDNKLTDTGINVLIKRTPKVFSTLKMLNLTNNKIGAKGLDTVFKTLSSTNNGLSHLTEISLWHNPLGVSGFLILEKAMRDGTLANLEMLHLQGSLEVDANVNSGILISFFEALSKHCPNFEYIDLSENNLGVPGACAIGKAISQLAQQTNSEAGFGISLNETMLGDEGITSFVQSLQGVCPLSMLTLSGNSIHSTGLLSLCDAISAGKLQFDSALQSELWLDENPLGVDGVLTLGAALGSSHCQLSVLSLSNCKLTAGIDASIDGDVVESIGLQLFQMQPNKTITKLFVRKNQFTAKGVYILAGLIHLCPNVENLFSSACEITSDDLRCLLDCLTELKSTSTLSHDICCMLNAWHLRENLIDDGGACILVEHQLSLLETAQNIDLSDNPDVSFDLVKRLQGDKPSTVMSNMMVVDQLLPSGKFVTTQMRKKLEESEESEYEEYEEYEDETVERILREDDVQELQRQWIKIVYLLNQLALEYLSQQSSMVNSTHKGSNPFKSDFIPCTLPSSEGLVSATEKWELDKIHHVLDGKGITIAILDSTVIYPEHKAFKKAIESKRIVSVPDDIWKHERLQGDHGSMAAFVAGGDGFVAERFRNNVGEIPLPQKPNNLSPPKAISSGIAPGAKLVMYHIDYHNLSSMVGALDDIIKRNKISLENKQRLDIDVISMSFGMEYDQKNDGQKEISHCLKQLNEQGVICVAAAGNFGSYQTGALFPANEAGYVISVGALDKDGNIAGSNPHEGNSIDVYAHGENIPFPIRVIDIEYKSQFILSTVYDNGVACSKGSSCAAPAISGLVALLLQFDQKKHELLRSDPEAVDILQRNYRDLNYLKNTVFKKDMKRGKPHLLHPFEYFKENCRLRL